MMAQFNRAALRRWGARVAAGLAGLVMVAGTASAQPSGSTGQLDERVRSALGVAGAGIGPSGPAVSGYEDVILLEPTKIFTVHMNLAFQQTDNAFLTAADPKPDNYLVGDLGFRAATTIADHWNIWADASLIGTLYGRHDALDYAAVAGELGASRDFQTRAGRLTLGAAYNPDVVFSVDFKTRQLIQHRLSGSVQLFTPLTAFGAALPSAFANNAAIINRLTIEKVFADPADYDNWGASWDFALICAPAPRLQVSVSTSLYLRRYGAYFPGLVGVDKRNDEGVRVGGSIAYAPSPNASFSFNLTWQSQRSTSDVNAFHTLGYGPSVDARIQF